MRLAATCLLSAALVCAAGSLGAHAQDQTAVTATPGGPETRLAMPLPVPNPRGVALPIHIAAAAHGAEVPGKALARRVQHKPKPRLALSQPRSERMVRRPARQPTLARGRDLGRFWPPVF